MDLKQLRYFLAVAQSGSLVEAGRAVHLSQPALGARVRQLENELGVELFRRHSRGVELTEAGRVLATQAKLLLEASEATRAAMKRFQTKRLPTLAIGLNPTASRTLAADLLVAFAGVADVRLREGMSHEIQQWVREGSLDAGFCYDPPSGAMGSIDIGQDALHLVGLPSVVRSSADVDFDTLSAYSLVLDGRLNVLRSSIEDTARLRGVLLNVSFEAEPVNLKRRLMLHHGHCTIVPYGLFGEEISNGTLHARRIVRPQIKRRYCLVLRRGLGHDECRLVAERALAVAGRRNSVPETAWIEPLKPRSGQSARRSKPVRARPL